MNKRFISGWLLLVLLSLLAACSTFSDPRQGATPDPSSYQFINFTLTGLITAGYDNQKLAITHNQAAAIIPLVQKWKAGNFGLTKEEARSVYEGILAVLNDDQRKFHPKPPAGGGDRPPRGGQDGDGAPPNGGPGGGGGFGAPGGGPGGAPPGRPGGPGRSLTTQDYLNLYDELMRLLKDL